jgi:peptide-methionine (R)-S-oxide reductase
MLTRRAALATGGSAIAVIAGAGLARWGGRAIAGQTVPVADHTFEVTKSDDEWRHLLTPAQYHVLRQQGTEAPFSSPLDLSFKPGTYDCAGCQLPLFSSSTKYDSGTGWPSFWKPLEHAVETSSDSSLGMDRTEVHCRRCGGHLGHVFDDGPQPTGLRYCMNGIALDFRTAAA